MPAKIKYEDFVDPAALNQLQKFWTQYGTVITTEMAKVKKELQTHLTTLNSIRGVNSQNINTLNQVSQSVEQNKTKYQQLNTINKEHERIKQALERAMARYTAEQSKEAKKLREIKEQTKQVIKEQNLQAGSIRKLREDTNKLVKTRENLNRQTKRGRQEFSKLTAQIARNERQLKKHDAQIGRSQRNVGNYASAFRNLGAAMGISLGIYGIFRVLKNAIGIMSGFQEQMSKVRAVTGATSDEMARLERDAMRLGRTTPKTASEVANLQFEFAKLGFTTQEILNATEATINLSIAAGSDLAQAAEVAGATVRGFGLRAADTQRVVDVMADSIASSALNIERFSESMKYVAPIAKVAGLSIEYTTAMLSKMADAGIHGSQAGTSLRMIISQLDRTGKGTAQSIKDLAEKGLTLADAQQEVGQRAKTALLVLADQTEQVDKLNEQYEEAAGRCKEMADIMQDNLVGEVRRLKSAWEGFILVGRDANSVLRLLVEGLRMAVEGMTPFDKQATKWEEYDERLKEITTTIQGLNDEAAKRIIQEYIFELDETVVDMFNSMARTSKRGKKLYDAWIEGVVELQNYLRGVLLDTDKLHKLTVITEKTEKKEAGSKKEIVGIINNLNKEIAETTKLKNEANNPAYIAFYDKEIKRLKEKVKYYESLSDALDKIAPKVAQITQDIDKAAGEITATLKYEPPKESIFRKFFRRLFGLGEDQKDKIKDAARTLFNELRDMLTGLNQQLIDLAEKRVDAVENTLNDLRDLLKEEQALKDEGKANDVARLQTQIAEENKIRAKAQSDLEKFNKTQNLLNTAQEISSLVTASANIIKGFSHIPIIGTALGIAAVVAMLGSYAALKAKISKMSKGYAEGTEYVERGNNPRGKDTIHARLNEGERVISTEDNKKLGNLTNKELVEELQYWNYYKNRTPGVTPRDMTGELIGQLKRQERLQRDTLDFMKSDAKIVELSNGKILVKKDNSIEIISYNA